MFRILEIETFVGKVYSIEMYNHQYESDNIRFKGVLDGVKTEIVGKDIFNYEVTGAISIENGMLYTVWTDTMLALADVIDFTGDDVSEAFYLDKYAQLILSDGLHIRNVGDQHKLQHSVCQVLMARLGSDSVSPEWYESFYVACDDKIYRYKVNDMKKFMAIAAKTRLLHKDVR